MSFLSNWVNKIQEFFVPRVNQTVEAIEVEVAAVEAKAKAAVAKVEAVVKKEAPKVKAAAKKVETALKTEAPKIKAAAEKAVKNAKAEIAGKRTRKGGKFVKDDPSTPNVNEAFKDGKAPIKKTKKNPSLKVEK
jgi:hypothetical protein